MIQYILFDLGFVLVELDGMPRFQTTLAENTSDTDLHRQWLSLECVRSFETGKISQDEFFQRAVDEMQLSQSPEQFAIRYRNWVRGPYPGAEPLLQQLKQKYRIGCLSNTNTCHIAHLERMGDFLNLFDDCFYSYQIGLMKPDPASFQHVLNQLALPPEQILFFDDSHDNVNAAKQLGLNSHQVKGFDALLMRLTQTLKTPMPVI